MEVKDMKYKGEDRQDVVKYLMKIKNKYSLRKQPINNKVASKQCRKYRCKLYLLAEPQLLDLLEDLIHRFTRC